MKTALLLPALALTLAAFAAPAFADPVPSDGAAAMTLDETPTPATPRRVPREAWAKTTWALPEITPWEEGENPFDLFRNNRTDYAGYHYHYRWWFDVGPMQTKFQGYYDPGDDAKTLTRIDLEKLQLKPDTGFEGAFHIVWFPIDRGRIAAGTPLDQHRKSWVFRYGNEFQRGVLQSPFQIVLDDIAFTTGAEFRTSLDWNHWEIGRHDYDPDLYEWEWVVRHVRGRLRFAPTDGSPAGNIYFDGGHDRYVYDRFVINTGFFRLRLGFALNPAVAIFRLFFSRSRDTVGVYAEGRIGMDFVASPEWKLSIGATIQTPTIVESRQTPNVVAYSRRTGYILLRFGF
jgi:hypothetical protein